MVEWTFNNELSHHGILGMKWGSKTRPRKTFYKIAGVKKTITISQYPEFYTYKIDTFKISKNK